MHFMHKTSVISYPWRHWTNPRLIIIITWSRDYSTTSLLQRTRSNRICPTSDFSRRSMPLLLELELVRTGSAQLSTIFSQHQSWAGILILTDFLGGLYVLRLCNWVVASLELRGLNWLLSDVSLYVMRYPRFNTSIRFDLKMLLLTTIIPSTADRLFVMTSIALNLKKQSFGNVINWWGASTAHHGLLETFWNLNCDLCLLSEFTFGLILILI